MGSRACSESSASSVQRALALGDGEAPFVQGLADDHPRQVHVTQLGERAEIRERGNTSGVDKGPPDCGGYTPDSIDVRTTEHAIMLDARVHESPDAARPEPFD